MIRILGIDPGSRITGFGIIESDGRQSRHIHSGCIRLKVKNFPERLGVIFQEVSDLLQRYQPEQMAIENVFVGKNAVSALKLGQARGAAICAGIQQNLSVYEYSPREVKQAIVGRGSADKQQIQHMTRLLLNLQQTPQTDTADALGIAICHAHSHLGRFNVHMK